MLTLRGRDRGRVLVYFELGEVTSGDEPAKFSEADQRLVIEGGEDGDEGKGDAGGVETWMLERKQMLETKALGLRLQPFHSLASPPPSHSPCVPVAVPTSAPAAAPCTRCCSQ